MTLRELIAERDQLKEIVETLNWQDRYDISVMLAKRKSDAESYFPAAAAKETARFERFSQFDHLVTKYKEGKKGNVYLHDTSTHGAGASHQAQR